MQILSSPPSNLYIPKFPILHHIHDKLEIPDGEYYECQYRDPDLYIRVVHYNGCLYIGNMYQWFYNNTQLLSILKKNVLLYDYCLNFPGSIIYGYIISGEITIFLIYHSYYYPLDVIKSYHLLIPQFNSINSTEILYIPKAYSYKLGQQISFYILNLEG